jgi:predicted permease
MDNKPKIARRFGLHIYLYCGVAILLVSLVPLLLFARYVVVDENTPAIIIMGMLASPILVWIALWLALRRCTSSKVKGMRGLLTITAYMSTGVGPYALLIAVPTTAAGIIGSMGISVASIGRGSEWAGHQFARMLSMYYRHRMYQ